MAEAREPQGASEQQMELLDEQWALVTRASVQAGHEAKHRLEP